VPRIAARYRRSGYRLTDRLHCLTPPLLVAVYDSKRMRAKEVAHSIRERVSGRPIKCLPDPSGDNLRLRVARRCLADT